MTAAIELRVWGTPAPQGSKTIAHARGRSFLRESSKAVKPWRDAIVAAATDAGIAGAKLDGPLRVQLTFWTTRPKAHYLANGLRDDAPDYVTTKPDIDKLARATFDALTQAGVIVDDSRVVRMSAAHLYADGSPGAHIRITSLSDTIEEE